MQIISDFSLKTHNTFGIDAQAASFVSVTSIEELRTVLSEHKNEAKLILGGGSNMLLTKNVDKLVIHVNLKGKEIVQENEDFVWVKAAAGENWHEFVIWCIDQNFGGIENMSLIPGNVGSAPIQNIGAYGVELKDTFDSCEALLLDSLTLKSFAKTDCNFGYRESVFKQDLKDQCVIVSVTLKLTKKNHVLHTQYGSIGDEMAKNNIENPTIKDISNTVIAIRKSKLPDPKELGNSGSFFKNPVVPKSLYDQVALQYPNMPSYKVSETEVKVPAGWLIEQAGYKGKRIGDAGVHKNQALVLVNYGNATGSEILDLAHEVQHAIFEKFGISIETEVNIL